MSAFPCLVCTSMADNDQDLVCLACIEAISDMIPPFAGVYIRTPRGRAIVRREMAEALARIRDNVIFIERGTPDAQG